MTNIVVIRYIITGDVYNEIKYNNFADLHNKLKLMIIKYDTDILMTLLINNKILNNFDIIDTSILSTLNENNGILIIFTNKNLKIQAKCLN